MFGGSAGRLLRCRVLRGGGRGEAEVEALLGREAVLANEMPGIKLLDASR